MTKLNDTPSVSTETLDNLPVAAIIFDNEKIHYINKAGFDILGLKNPKDFFKKQRSVFEFLLPAFREPIRKNNIKILSGKPFERIDFSIKTPKGNVCDIESRSNRILFKGKPAIQTIILEITNRKQREEELLRKTELFNQINRHANDIFFKFDFYPKPHFTFISDSLHDILGYKKSDFIGDPKFYEKVIYPEDKGKFIFSVNDLNKFLKSKQTGNTIRFFRKNKSTVWLETVYTPIRDSNGNIVSIIGISRDVTEFKKTQDELINSNEKFNLISTNAREIIYFFTYQPKPKYIYMSPSVKQVLGYEPDVFYKDAFFISKKTIGKSNDLKKHEVIAASQQKRNAFKSKSVIYQVKSADGKILWMEDNVSPIMDEKGKVKFLFGIVRNITELKEKEAELNQKWSDYHQLLNESPMAFVIHDQGICRMCNKELLKILKAKSEKDVLGKNLINYIIPEQRIPVLERVKQVLKGKELGFKPYKIVNTKNETVNIELRSVPVKYNGVNSVLTIIQDVSQKEIYEKERLRAEIAEEHNKHLIKEIELRKRVEEKLKQHEKEITLQAAKLSAIFESSSHLVWTVNNKLELTYFNNNYRNTFKKKYGIFPILGKQAFAFIPESFKKENKSLWHPYYKRVLEGEYVVFERRDKNNKGEEIFREVFLSPIKNEAGKVVEIACLAHDVTDSKKFEKQNIEKAAKLRAIFESGTHIMWTFNKENIYTSFNTNFSNAINDLYGKRPVLGQPLVTPTNPREKQEYLKFWAGKAERVFKGEIVEFITERINRKGEKSFRQIYLHPIYDDKNNISEVSGMGIDITDKILNEQKVKNQTAKLQAIFDGGLHYIWTINQKNELTSFNHNYSRLIKLVYGLESKLGTVINKGKMVSKRAYNEWWNNQYKKAFAGETINFETTFTDKKNNKIFLEVFLNPVYEGGKIIEVSGIAHDISDRIKNAEQIKEQAAKLKAIFESGSQLIWTINHKKEITSFNQNYANAIYNLYGFYPQENKSIRQLGNGATKPYQEFWDEKYDLAFSGVPAEFTTERFNRDGTKVYRQYVLYPIKDQNNQVIEVSGLGIDITENKRYEERITQSLKEKEILLKEVHHRVKNNMQVISSILNLQSSYVTDNYALNLLKESQNRIKTMAYIHESLYQNKTFSSINFSDYVTTLTNNILHSYTASIQKVRLVMDLQKVILNLDTSIPAGLIINELVTNSIKHAFNDEKEGIIFINLYTKDNILFLEVSDNGKGFPKEVDFKNTNSLGLQLVNTLVEQLNGNIELRENKEKGTGFFINFPM